MAITTEKREADFRSHVFSDFTQHDPYELRDDLARVDPPYHAYGEDIQICKRDDEFPCREDSLRTLGADRKTNRIMR